MATTGLEGLEAEYDLVIVGAGLSGATYAEQAAARFGWSSLIIDKRDHIGALATAGSAASLAWGCVLRVEESTCGMWDDTSLTRPGPRRQLLRLH